MPNPWEKMKMNEGLLSLHDPGKEEFQIQVFAIWAAYRMTPFKGTNHKNATAPKRMEARGCRASS